MIYHLREYTTEQPHRKHAHRTIWKCWDITWQEENKLETFKELVQELQNLNLSCLSMQFHHVRWTELQAWYPHDIMGEDYNCPRNNDTARPPLQSTHQWPWWLAQLTQCNWWYQRENLQLMKQSSPKDKAAAGIGMKYTSASRNDRDCPDYPAVHPSGLPVP